ncbi:hypothetical protein STSP2_01209 [Anaerohalosphaera lusitana]|uniref:HTH crp-type domain-containing protein n=1 Tax=Anaerohalosphaera lusitana TaxID=1936003 RepID=A0A1U9NJY7_9BACT|nr:helix-turn-helix domain-containing protein [Anaerohalosphaera lusitana]AQT68054.1 hypothetical protein STSP2_01209 [Anaerohalosphaera lusitana]
MNKVDHIRIPAQVFKLPLKGLCETCIMGLVYSFKKDGLRLSNAQMARLLNTSCRTVERAVSKLRKRGLIENKNDVQAVRCLVAVTDIESMELPTSGADTKSGVPTLSTDDMPGGTDVVVGQAPTSSTDTASGVPTCRGVNTDVHVDHKEERIEEEEEECSSGVRPVEFMDYWNAKDNLPRIRAFSDQRRSKFKARMAEGLFAENWQELIDMVSGSSFLTGKNDRNWRADIDWLLKNSTNYAKVLEGKYNNRNAQTKPSDSKDKNIPFTPEQEAEFLAKHTRKISEAEADKLFREIGLT